MNKKQKERIFTIISVSFLAVAFFVAVYLLLADQIGNTTVTIESKTARVGENVTLPLTIEKNHGLFMGQVIIEYDPEALEFVTGGNGDVFSEFDVNGVDIEAGKVCMILNEHKIENTQKDGALASVTFRVKEDAKKGDYKVKISNPEKVEDGTYFLRVQDIDSEKWTVPKYKDGTITVR